MFTWTITENIYPVRDDLSINEVFLELGQDYRIDFTTATDPNGGSITYSVFYYTPLGVADMPSWASVSADSLTILLTQPPKNDHLFMNRAANA